MPKCLRAKTDDRPDLHGRAPGGALRSAEQRPRPGLPARCRAGVEFVERDLHRDRRRADGGLGSRAGRDVGRPELRSLRRRTHAVSGVADPGQRRQRRDCRSTRGGRDGLHHRAGRHADTARAGRQPRHPRCAAGDEFPWHQYDSDRPERGRLRADVGPGRHCDGHLSNHRRRGGRSVAADHPGTAGRQSEFRCVDPIRPRRYPPTRSNSGWIGCSRSATPISTTTSCSR